MQKNPALRFLRFVFLIAACLLVEKARAAEDERLVYIGTYTGAASKGIYVARLNLATGQLSKPELAVETSSPSFLALRPDGRFLYAVNEVNTFEGKPTGAVSAFALNPASGQLTLLNQQSSGGTGPCHLVVDRQGKHVIVANYSGGSTAALAIQEDGKLGAQTAFIQHTGSSVNKSRQAEPHAHGVTLDAAQRFAFVPDLGLDKVIGYRFDAARGTLSASAAQTVSVPPGAGPRHFTFDPSEKNAYTINELDCTITAFSFDAVPATLKQIQTISTLPTGETRQPSYSTAEIAVHPSGKFVYGSNRGHNSIAVFARHPATGLLTLLQNEPTQGRTPRNFTIAPGGRWLLAANQDSNSVVVFAIDQETGKLTATGGKIEVAKPVCLVFVPQS